jgi:hypothetical protein
MVIVECGSKSHSQDLEIQVKSGKWEVDLVKCIGGDGRAGKYRKRKLPF